MRLSSRSILIISNLNLSNMKRILLVSFMLVLSAYSIAWAQRTVTGAVTGQEDGTPIPGVNVVLKGTTIGTVTDIDGKYQIDVPQSGGTLVFSFIGLTTEEVEIGNQSVINMVMIADLKQLTEVVVTALGINREERSLGYAVQEISGDEVNTVKSDNFINSLSGKIAGVNIKSNGNMGGSTNIVIRGAKSLYQSNQALFVVDGVPIDNSNTNNEGQLSGRSGYDYGNFAADINPNDIASISVLKGAAATALYGSRASNGVIMITTKKGSETPGKKLGVNISSNVTLGVVDKSTFPTYQQSYGGGYGPFYSDGSHPGLEQYADVNGDGTLDLTVPYYEDASYGEKFDPSLMVYQWDAFIPESSNFGKATPWVAGKNGPISFFNTSKSLTNSVDISGGTDKSSFRLGYTNQTFNGVMPNSSLVKNNVTLNGSWEILKGLKASASATYMNENAVGRNSTGYSDNILSSFRQWFEVNVDIKAQEEMFSKTGRNATWNRVAWDDGTPAYWDNPYWIRYKNYESDNRDRLLGYAQLDWEATKWLSFMGRLSVDTYSHLEEERKAVGSVSGELGVDRPDVTSGYSRLTRNYLETNFDFMAKFNKDLSQNFNLSALVGTNIRRSKVDQVFASTNGGLIVPDIYALSNSLDPQLPPEERYQQIGVNGFFANATLGYKSFLYLDGSFRQDISSTLPSDNWAYNYPSITGTFIFSELMSANWLSLGKIRLNYAEVGSGAPWGSVIDTYTLKAPFSGNAIVSVDNTKNNENLKPERTKSLEAGLQMNFVDNRLGIDLSFYKTNTVDLITPISVSFATGYSYRYLNAGELENRGVELTLNATPVKLSNFSWDISVNWSKNQNKVISLAEGLKNLPLDNGLQGGVSVNARIGEPYGAIQGTDYVYLNGRPVVKSNGYYQLSSTSDVVIGNVNPDWLGGINNVFRYKNVLTFSFLIDIQHGGDVFSLDQWYGQGTGLYPETVFTNDLGNPVRSAVDDGGGLILNGVQADGSENQVRIEGGDYRWAGWASNPNSAFVYDASYVKLREVRLTYNLPTSLLQNISVYKASLSFVGSNLWIIQKNLPYSDPEAGQSSGNIQGWQSGVMPSIKNYGFTLNVQF